MMLLKALLLHFDIVKNILTLLFLARSGLYTFFIYEKVASFWLLTEAVLHGRLVSEDLNVSPISNIATLEFFGSILRYVSQKFYYTIAMSRFQNLP